MKDIDIAVMVGGFPRKAGMERKDVMSKNVSIYQSQAAAIEKHASKDVKVTDPAAQSKQSSLFVAEEGFRAVMPLRSGGRS